MTSCGVFFALGSPGYWLCRMACVYTTLNDINIKQWKALSCRVRLIFSTLMRVYQLKLHHFLLFTYLLCSLSVLNDSDSIYCHRKLTEASIYWTQKKTDINTWAVLKTTLNTDTEMKAFFDCFFNTWYSLPVPVILFLITIIWGGGVP